MSGKELYEKYKGKKGKDSTTGTEGVIIGYVDEDEDYVIAKVTKDGEGDLPEGWHSFSSGDILVDDKGGNKLGYIYLEEEEININDKK